MTKITHSEEYRAVLDAAAKIAATAGRTFFTSADLFAGLAFVAPDGILPDDGVPPTSTHLATPSV